MALGLLPGAGNLAVACTMGSDARGWVVVWLLLRDSVMTLMC